jgi:hypothetical protein
MKIVLVAAALAASAGTVAAVRTAPHAKPGRGGFNHLPVRGTPRAAHHGKAPLGFDGGDDWEPEIAASGSFVYVAWTHFPGDTVSDPTSGGAKRVMIQVSTDGGVTFGAEHMVADLPGGNAYSDQGDSTVIVDEAGNVYVTFLAWGLKANKTDTWVAKSTDHGATFPQVRKVNAAANTDHPWSAARGSNVYTTYAQGNSHFLSHSTDGGNTWTETEVLVAGNVAFPEGAVVDANGDAWFSWSDCRSSNCTGTPAVDFRVSRTRAGTNSTTFVAVANSPQGPSCPYSSCGFAFWSPQDDIAIDAGGNLYLVWQDGQPENKAKSPTIINLSKCAAGRDCMVASNWVFQSRVDDKSSSSAYALFPRVEGGAANQVSVIWMDDRAGAPLDHKNGWNVWLRSSANGGASWSTGGRQISSYDPSRSESLPNGFLFPYGDYQGIVFIPQSHGSLLGLVWGEGWNWNGGANQPGHVVYRSIAP